WLFVSIRGCAESVRLRSAVAHLQFSIRAGKTLRNRPTQALFARQNRRAGISQPVRCRDLWHIGKVNAAKRSQMRIFYSGRVQGIGFRISAKSVANGFEVTGTVRNLPDGRVELVAEGQRDELEAFRAAIRESGLGHFIANEQVSWTEAT